jgi:hypothetical protein
LQTLEAPKIDPIAQLLLMAEHPDPVTLPIVTVGCGARPEHDARFTQFVVAPQQLQLLGLLLNTSLPPLKLSVRLPAVPLNNNDPITAP